VFPLVELPRPVGSDESGVVDQDLGFPELLHELIESRHQPHLVGGVSDLADHAKSRGGESAAYGIDARLRGATSPIDMPCAAKRRATDAAIPGPAPTISSPLIASPSDSDPPPNPLRVGEVCVAELCTEVCLFGTDRAPVDSRHG
jgi:hypothetical protein